LNTIIAGISLSIGGIQVQCASMAKPATTGLSALPANNTVKMPAVLGRRVVQAMQVEGFTVWSEFCRVALTEKCHATEDQLRARDPLEFQRVYGIRAILRPVLPET
jgi:hypothetical protein